MDDDQVFADGDLSQESYAVWAGRRAVELHLDRSGLARHVADGTAFPALGDVVLLLDVDFDGRGCCRQPSERFFSQDLRQAETTLAAEASAVLGQLASCRGGRRFWRALDLTIRVRSMRDVVSQGIDIVVGIFVRMVVSLDEYRMKLSDLARAAESVELVSRMRCDNRARERCSLAKRVGEPAHLGEDAEVAHRFEQLESLAQAVLLPPRPVVLPLLALVVRP